MTNDHGPFSCGEYWCGICDEWRGPEGYVRFLEHVGRRPSRKHSIDRIDNARGYEPGNVRWATDSEQARNKSNTRHLTAFGETRPLAEWSERSGISVSLLRDRIYSRGWAAERALSEPPDHAGGQFRLGHGRPRVPSTVPRGEASVSSKLTAEAVRQIRAHGNTKRGDIPRLARAFGVGTSTVRSVLERQTWKHIA